MTTKRTSLHQFFGGFPDPRIKRNKRHELLDIIVLTILAVVCGAESWDSIELFGKTKIDFLKQFLKLRNGIPSHDTINRVFSILDPKLFEEVFIKWVNFLRDKNIDIELIAIGGKTVRRSKDTFNEKSPVHLVNAWACKTSWYLVSIKQKISRMKFPQFQDCSIFWTLRAPSLLLMQWAHKKLLLKRS